jgi:very-short-patch-repair endonuclease
MPRRRLPPREFRRYLRKCATDSEQELWGRLRRGRLGPRFRRQHTAGPYTLDFYCPAARLAVELDGGQHYHGTTQLLDAKRDAWLEERGIRVLRYSAREVLAEPEAVEEAIWRAAGERVGAHDPSRTPPPPRGDLLDALATRPRARGRP